MLFAWVIALRRMADVANCPNVNLLAAANAVSG
jgi:hypothetical protein